MKYIFAFIGLLIMGIEAKVLIITHNYNSPDFIELQYKTFKKFLTDDYEYVVFNDAQDRAMEQSIKNMCDSYDIRCIRIPQDIHTRPYLPRLPGDNVQQNNFRHANCVHYSLDTIGFDFDGIVFIVDSDVVLLRSFSVEKYMQDKDIAALVRRPERKAYYCSPFFCIMNMQTLPDKKSISFNCGTINGVNGDSGGCSYYYLKQHPYLRVSPISVVYSHQLFLADKHIGKLADKEVSNDYKISFYNHYGFNDYEVRFLLKKPDTFEFCLDSKFLHYRGISYTQRDPHKHAAFLTLIYDILNADISAVNNF